MEIDEACTILSISLENATPATARSAYRQLAIKHHPDKNPGKEKDATAAFQQLSRAYATVTNHLETQKRNEHPHTHHYHPAAGSGDGTTTPQNDEFDPRSVFREAFGVDFYDDIASVASELAKSAATFLEESGRR
eukprot:CAMPEP_0172516472 /NCGR_PEP_ID=MMETSP1066-20121228/276555_1 /TAXON_ID=671091 /ORGANISM="Coscinodiscus wailesii, Strain CCMP2513" /LENGTH=134 /DNA_ID=CAMNT_0013297975 /DNA_START=93 /DNA_END=493 /DNA_ORIENTATION=+